MFDSLSDQIKHDDQVETTPKQRFMKWALMIVLSVVLFGGLYVAVRVLE